MSGAALPNAHAAVVPAAKVRLYLLDPGHPGNGGKAGFFNAFGFTAGEWGALRDGLLAHAGLHPVVRVAASAWGMKYEVRCGLPSPDGRNPCVRSIWVIDATSPYPRLVTAYAYP
jgi:hypothetical protein